MPNPSIGSGSWKVGWLPAVANLSGWDSRHIVAGIARVIYDPTKTEVLHDGIQLGIEMSDFRAIHDSRRIQKAEC
jgi:hypothetical protein